MGGRAAAEGRRWVDGEAGEVKRLQFMWRFDSSASASTRRAKRGASAQLRGLFVIFASCL